ncbi:hypothetical protein PRIO_3208 [Paenibacillus riograndensis SBR5]|uniref:Uncharacterized protein n=1 Tax=Paenibacillus riograndensis SBR5 TaxID=1073571 RepID=A0A0E4CWT2_9BACL|nr:hypothetical protein PRIO_3208 [Paenibacillus riograndensis SBR5]
MKPATPILRIDRLLKSFISHSLNCLYKLNFSFTLWAWSSLRGMFGLPAAVVPRFLDWNRLLRLKSGDKGGRYRSSSSKLPLRTSSLL